MKEKILSACQVVLLITVSPAWGGQHEFFLDLSRIKKPAEEPRGGWGSGFGGGGLDALKVTIAGLDRMTYRYGAAFTYEITIENTSNVTITIPWSVDWKQVRGGGPPSRQPPPGYKQTYLILNLTDPHSGKFEVLGWSLEGSDLLAGSLKPLAPGERARIRAEGRWTMWTVPIGRQNGQQIESLAESPSVFHVTATFWFGYQRTRIEPAHSQEVVVTLVWF